MSTDDDLLNAALKTLSGLEGVLLGALDLMPVPLWITDNHGHIRWTNQATAEAFGAAPAIHFSRLIAPERANDARELFARKVTGASDSTVQRTVLLTLAGKMDAEVASVPLRRDATVAGMLFMARLTSVTHVAGHGNEARPRLTPRQHEVLKLLADGRTTEQIAAELGIAQDTARNHIRQLLNELRVHSRLAAVVAAFRNGWL